MPGVLKYPHKPFFSYIFRDDPKPPTYPCSVCTYLAIPHTPLPLFNIKWPLTKISYNLVENLKILIFKVI